MNLKQWMLIIGLVLIAAVSRADTDCDRICKSASAVNHSPNPMVVSQFEAQMESWANLLMEMQDAPTYLTYMDGYQLIASKDLNHYAARYVRRKLRGKELSSLYGHLETHSDQSLSKILHQTLSVDEQEVDAYIRRLMWVRMREARRYLIRRLDEVYGLSSLNYRLRLETRKFIGHYMVQQAERWSFHNQEALDGDLKDQVNHWLMTEIDVQEDNFQTQNYHQVINRLTYVLRNVSDQQIRQAIAYYEHEQYQAMLALIRKALTFHFQRLRVKNSLSDPETSAQ
ncbi:hypothetical protein ACFOEK_16360 [Litoribrevibacter euphylliae]|uniref:DUF2059 domain-containing protein n=1 Tax=Litoribrevibacter euphylliae TaxID=1834034 RepID=A0ABV7HFH4_9GAMM